MPRNWLRDAGPCHRPRRTRRRGAGCQFSHHWQNRSVTFDLDAALRLIAESPGFVDQSGADPIAVRSVSMSGRTLVAEITARSTDPMTARGEIAGVMGALSGPEVSELLDSGRRCVPKRRRRRHRRRDACLRATRYSMIWEFRG